MLNYPSRGLILRNFLINLSNRANVVRCFNLVTEHIPCSEEKKIFEISDLCPLSSSCDCPPETSALCQICSSVSQSRGTGDSLAAENHLNILMTHHLHSDALKVQYLHLASNILNRRSYIQVFFLKASRKKCNALAFKVQYQSEARIQFQFSDTFILN